MQGGAPQSSAGIPSGKSYLALWMLPDVPAGRGLATGGLTLLILAEPVEPAAPEPSHAEPGVGSPGEPRTGWDGQEGARHGLEPLGSSPTTEPAGFLASEQWLRAGSASVAHWAAAHGSAQPGGWNSIGGENTGSSSKSQALPEMDSLTAGSSKNCIFRKLGPLSAQSSFESWILQERDPPRAGSCEHQILL